MKKTILIAALTFISLTGFSQKTDTTKQKTDTVLVYQFTDADLGNFYNELNKQIYLSGWSNVQLADILNAMSKYMIQNKKYSITPVKK